MAGAIRRLTCRSVSPPIEPLFPARIGEGLKQLQMLTLGEIKNNGNSPAANLTNRRKEARGSAFGSASWPQGSGTDPLPGEVARKCALQSGANIFASLGSLRLWHALEGCVGFALGEAVEIRRHKPLRTPACAASPTFEPESPNSARRSPGNTNFTPRAARSVRGSLDWSQKSSKSKRLSPSSSSRAKRRKLRSSSSCKMK